jgi:hypothetical protein
VAAAEQGEEDPISMTMEDAGALAPGSIMQKNTFEPDDLRALDVELAEFAERTGRRKGPELDVPRMCGGVFAPDGQPLEMHSSGALGMLVLRVHSMLNSLSAVEGATDQD